MLTINKVFPEKTIPEKTDSFLFFDIETTGFSKDNTILYLIGCGYFMSNGFLKDFTEGFKVNVVKVKEL